MRLRKYTFIIASIITVVLFILSLTVFDQTYRTTITLISSLVFLSSLIYFLYGFPRLLIYFIYGLLTILAIRFSKEEYRLLLVFLFTILIVLNPLAFFENYLDNTLKKKITKPYEFKITGRYETFYKYRKKMKEYYHLPQTRKLFTLRWYKLLRHVVVILLFSCIIFLIILTTSLMLVVNNLHDVNILLVYFQISLTMMLIVLYKSGFTSMFRVARLTLFPTFYYFIYISNLSSILQILSYSIVSLALLGIILYELYFYYTRVKYQAYEYLDPLTNRMVFANALYEPFIYDSSKYSILYEFEASIDLFHKKRFELIVFANFCKTIITSYENEKRKIYLYVEMYKEEMIEKFSIKLSTLFKTSIKTSYLEENYYEKKFLHNHEYIITRALSLAYLVNELQIKEELIIKTTMYFNSLGETKELLLKYDTEVKEALGKIVLDVNLRVKNVDFLIESKLRDLLLDMLVHGGTFVRIQVYY